MVAFVDTNGSFGYGSWFEEESVIRNILEADFGEDLFELVRLELAFSSKVKVACGAMKDLVRDPQKEESGSFDCKSFLVG